MAYGTGTHSEVSVGEEAEPPFGVWRPPAGPIVIQAMIETRAYPWKAGRHARDGSARKRMQAHNYNAWKDWTTGVRMVLTLHHKVQGGGLVRGPVDLDMLFVLEPSHCPPDRTNLGKSFEDILQSIVYENDRQVQGGDVRRVFLGDSIIGREGERWEGLERIHFRVTSLS